MATIVTDEFRNALLGGETHSQPNFVTDNVDASLLDASDANGGVPLTAANVVQYSDVNDADVVDTTNVGVSSVTDGVVVLTGSLSFTGTVGGEHAADYCAIWSNSGDPATSPVWIIFDSASSGLPVTPTGAAITGAFVDNELVSLVAT